MPPFSGLDSIIGFSRADVSGESAGGSFDPRSSSFLEGDDGDRSDVSATTASSASAHKKSSMRSPSGSDRARMRKSVSFVQQERVEFIPNLASYTKQEKESIWLTRQEIKAIKDDCIYTLEIVENGLTYLLLGKSQDEICLRGLELHTAQGLKTRKRNRETCRTLVLGETKDDADSSDDEDDNASVLTASLPNQRKRGARVSEARSRRYSDASFRSAIQAHVMGLKDAEEAAKQ